MASISSLCVALPKDLRSREARQAVQRAVAGLMARLGGKSGGGLPTLEPGRDVALTGADQAEDVEIKLMLQRREEVLSQLREHPLYREEKELNNTKKDGLSLETVPEPGSESKLGRAEEAEHALYQLKAEKQLQIGEIEERLRESQLSSFRRELHQRSRVLQRLGHCTKDGVVLLKGRAACLVNTADELLSTELLFHSTCCHPWPSLLSSQDACA